MAESRLERWSRIKNEARKEAELAPLSTTEPEAAPEEQELTVNEALPEQALLEKYDLPAPESIELGTDITGFMRKEIPEFLRRKALRALWRSNPVLAVLDGLNDYDEDFTTAGKVMPTIKTLYKVGEGLIDKSARHDKPVDRSPPLENQNEEQAEPDEPEEAATRTEPETAAEPLTSADPPEPAPIQTETEAEPEPRYRPRMRFDC